ncbi:MAG: lipid-binding SYLF domain-containing protein [Alphaproteobacteria bacterium]
MIKQKSMVKKLSATLAILFIVSGCGSVLGNGGNSADKAQKLVENSKDTVCRFRSVSQEKLRTRDLFKNAKGVVVLPSVVRGGYIGGLDTGSGTLITKGNSGNWGYPSFYAVSNLSFGFQAGIDSSEMVLFLMSNKAVDAVIKNQFRFGATAGLSVLTWGGGAEGATTTNMGADIVMLNRTKLGLYGGAALKSGSLVRRKDYNEAYYGEGTDPIHINLEHKKTNENAQGLRLALSGGC